MKKLFAITVVALYSMSLHAQDITGTWNGVLQVMGLQLKLVLHVEKTPNGYTSKLDSPDQNAFGIPVTSTTFDGKVFEFNAEGLNASYKGEWKDSIIVGIFTQRGMEMPLNLTRKAAKVEAAKRPQEPIPPFPYISEDVQFSNPKAGITLAGTLTLPFKEGCFAAAILISGSGPQNRNEELLGHKPFLVIADYLTRNGIAVLRFDDRGTAKSGGKFQGATSTDFATDVASALAYLRSRKEINQKAIGLIGHSEGGTIAPMVAAGNKDVAFVVMLAGPGVQGDKIILAQQQLIGKANGASEKDLKESNDVNAAVFDMVLKVADSALLRKNLLELLDQKIRPSDIPPGESKAGIINQQVDRIMDPWLLNFLRYNPSPILSKVKQPVLALNGLLDLQVPAVENIDAIKVAMTKNKKLTTKIYSGLNHLFQHAKTGAPSEYAKIEETFSAEVLEDIMKWIYANVKVH